jgi:hypothetical protein
VIFLGLKQLIDAAVFQNMPDRNMNVQQIECHAFEALTCYSFNL